MARHVHAHCKSNALRHAQALCHEQGLRFTPLRQRVLEMIWDSHAPSKPYDLLERLKHEEFNAQPPTVYRALEFLQAHGLVHRLNSLHAFVGCTHPQAHADCTLLICTQCGNVTESCEHEVQQAVLNAAAKASFHMKQTWIEIMGHCADCTQHAH